MDCRVPVEWESFEGIAYEVLVEGLKGGHSGTEIQKERGNANCLFARLLWILTQKLDVGIQKLEGGLADNAIPRQTKAVLVIEPKDSASFAEICDVTAARIGEGAGSEGPGLYHCCGREGKGELFLRQSPDTRRAAAFLNSLPTVCRL